MFCLPEPGIGQIFSLVIIFLTILELIAYYLSHPDYFSESQQGKDSSQDRANQLQTRALTLVGVVFAIVTFAVSSGSSQNIDFTPSLTLLALSAGLLLISYQSKNLTQTIEFWAIVQETTLEQGFVAFIFGLSLLFLSSNRTLGIIVTATATIVVLLRYYPVYRELRMYRKMSKKEDQTDTNDS